jgi:dATP pyrophosphohydrolase
MKLPIQVEAIAYRETNDVEHSRQIGGRMLQFLALHRTPERGGFWQPLTGGVEDYDDDTMAAVRREIGEELNVTDEQIVAVNALEYQFSFPDDQNVTLTEYAFGVELAPDTEVVLSDEHDDLRWDAPEAISALFKWRENQEALDALLDTL